MGYDPVELATRVVGSRLSVTEWVDKEGCGIGKTSVYRALNWCRLNRPSVFGSGEGAAVASGGCHGWYQRVLAAMRGGSPATPTPPQGSGSFVRLDSAPRQPAVRATATPAPIVVELGGARVSLPAGFDAADAEAAIAATARAMGMGVAS